MSRQREKLKEPRTCRIFFSSPFKGMEEEREELTRKYFPQIQHACNLRGIQFVAVDMRWGITSQAAETAQVINICLQEIDRSDIFVGFFGQRYGWHGEQDQVLQKNFDNVMGRYPWVDSFRDKSVTELEFLHGHLNDPGRLPACICFREMAYDDALRAEALAKGDKKVVYNYSSESEKATLLMNDLKLRVQATADKCLAVNMAYSHPHEGAKFMFDAVWKYLTEVLLADVESEQLSKREIDLAEHDAFLASRTILYTDRLQEMNYLDDMLCHKTDAKCVLVSGPSGIGKSALLCNWIVHVQSTQPEVLLIYHFVGCAPGSTAPQDILQRLNTELKHCLNVDGNQTENDDKKKNSNSHTVQMLQQSLLALMEEAGKIHGRQVVLVLDGLNCTVKMGKTSKHLFWLPVKFPSNVMFVTSSVDTDLATHDLLVTNLGYHTLFVQPLDADKQSDLCKKVLKKNGKKLSPEQHLQVVSTPNTQNPLFLRIVLSELSMFGYFHFLNKRIDDLVSCRDVKELLQKVFTRMEMDYNIEGQHSNLVMEVLSAIELSHHGLSEKELIEIFQVPSQVWLPLYFAIVSLLVNHSGLFRFGFGEISDAVRDKYLHTDDNRSRILRKLISYFDHQLQKVKVWNDLMTPLAKRSVEELPWLMQAAGDKEGLAKSLLNIFVLQRLQKEQEYEFLELWKSTGWSMEKISIEYEKVLNLALCDKYLHSQENNVINEKNPPAIMLRPLLMSLKNFFTTAGYPQGAAKMLQREISLLGHLKELMDNQQWTVSNLDAHYYLACAYVDMNELDLGKKLHQEVMDTCHRLLKETPDNKCFMQTLGYICNGIGIIFLHQKHFEEALPYFKESMALHDQLGNNECISEALTNQAVGLLELGKVQEALQCFQDALKAEEDYTYGHISLKIGNLLTNIGLCYRRMDRLNEAEAMYKKSLEVKAAVVGWDHDVVATAYVNLGVLEMYRNNFATMEEHIRKALMIMEGNGGTLSRPDYRRAIENLVLALVSQDKNEEALPIFISVFQELKKLNEMDLCLDSLHRHMVKYLIHIGNTEMAREVTEALINSSKRHFVNYIHWDHLQSLLPPDNQRIMPSEYTLDHALTIWPGKPDLIRQKIVNHSIPAGDLETVLCLLEDMDAKNEDFGASTYEVGAIWCEQCQSPDLAVQVLEAGIEKYPQSVTLRLQVMEIYRTIHQHALAYPHLPHILAARGDDPAAVIVSGDIASRAGDYSLAEECFEKVIHMDNAELAEKANQALSSLKIALSSSKEESLEVT